MTLEIGAKNPSLNVLAQYVKDLSIENPAPLRLIQDQEGQEGELMSRVKLDLQVHPAHGETFEVVVAAQLEISRGDKRLYVAELAYATLVELQDVDAESLPIILFLRAPMIAFPGLRHVMRLVTQESGLPPFQLQESNFIEMLQQKLNMMQEKVSEEFALS